jgi:hypothetical protein
MWHQAAAAVHAELRPERKLQLLQQPCWLLLRPHAPLLLLRQQHCEVLRARLLSLSQHRHLCVRLGKLDAAHVSTQEVLSARREGSEAAPLVNCCQLCKASHIFWPRDVRE